MMIPFDHAPALENTPRYLGTIYLDNKPVNREMVAAGLAWHYVEYSTDPEFAAAESAARRSLAPVR